MSRRKQTSELHTRVSRHKLTDLADRVLRKATSCLEGQSLCPNTKREHYVRPLAFQPGKEQFVQVTRINILLPRTSISTSSQAIVKLRIRHFAVLNISRDMRADAQRHRRDPANVVVHCGRY